MAAGASVEVSALERRGISRCGDLWVCDRALCGGACPHVRGRGQISPGAFDLSPGNVQLCIDLDTAGRSKAKAT